MFTRSSYYICASGEVRKRANAYRDAHAVLYKALWAVVHSLGSDKASIDTTRVKLRGVVFAGAAPEGWTKPDKHKLSRPKNLKANAEMLKHFTPSGGGMVERPPSMQVFFDWLACPSGYEYTCGDNHKGWSRIGEGLAPTGLYWYSSETPILLKTPDFEDARRYAAGDGCTVVGDTLNWTPPKGCKPILHEEWALMQAKYERDHPDQP